MQMCVHAILASLRVVLWSHYFSQENRCYKLFMEINQLKQYQLKYEVYTHSYCVCNYLDTQEEQKIYILKEVLKTMEMQNIRSFSMQLLLQLMVLIFMSLSLFLSLISSLNFYILLVYSLSYRSYSSDVCLKKVFLSFSFLQ